MRKYFLLIMIFMTGSVVIACDNMDVAYSHYYETDIIEQMSYEVDGDHFFDEQGNLLVPYDVAYSEAFESGQVDYEKDTLLIKFPKDEAKMDKVLESLGIASLTQIMAGNKTVWCEAKIKPNLDIVEVMAKIRKLDRILIADYNYLARSEEISTFPDIQDNPRAPEQLYLTDAGIEAAWEWLEANGHEPGGLSSVVVGVIDTGVDYGHLDLAANMWVNTAEIPGNGIDDDANGFIDDIHGANVVGGVESHSGDPMDDHGHGTHVSGIIAAANNNEGIVGIAYNSKIMAIKAGQASGYFNQTDIAEAILYAFDMGADVINMSFGGSGMSIAVQDALMTAFSRCVLVASAGNAGAPNEDVPGFEPLPNYPAAYSYVIGVMSVGASHQESAFTNWDVNKTNAIEYEIYAPGEQMLSTLPNDQYAAWSGTSMSAPVVSAIAALLRSVYTDRDLYPSKFIMGQIISTSESIVTCLNPDLHSDHNIPHVVDAYLALTKLPKPSVNLYDHYIFDSESISSVNNGDGIIDAGETIDIAMVLKNQWGMSENTIVTIDADSSGGIANPYISFVTNDIDFGSIGTFSSKDQLLRDGSVVTGVTSPHRVTIAPDTPNDTIIEVNVHGLSENGLDPLDTVIYEFTATIQLVVRSGMILPNIISEDLFLTNDNYYIIPNSMLIEAGATVTVEAGTKIQFWTNDPEDPYADIGIVYLLVEGKLITQGSETEMVELFPSEFMSRFRVEIREANGGYVELNYTKVTNGYLNISKAYRSMFTLNYLDTLFYRQLDGTTVCTYDDKPETVDIDNTYDSIFYVIGPDQTYYRPILNGYFHNCIFVDSGIGFHESSRFDDCVFLKNNTSDHSLAPINSAITLQSPLCMFDFTEAVYNSDTNSTYVKVSERSYYWFSMNRLWEVIDFANYMSGDLLIAQTQAEWDFVKANVATETSLTGLMKSGSLLSWSNGTVAGDFVELNLIPPYDGHVIFEPGWSVTEFGGSARNFIIELPGNISTDQMYSALDAFLEAGLNRRISNSAFLNDFNSTDLNYWFRIAAPGINNVNTSLYMKSIGLGGNYWGTTDPVLVNRQIVDFDDYQELWDINEGDILLTPPETAFPFVSDVYVLNNLDEVVSTVGSETIQVVVEFNRDMDITVPLTVRFGSEKPYADHQIPGSYETPRKWIGTFHLSTTMENGNQYFLIENGHALGDSWFALQPDRGRFTFEIDTTGAQAMVMQGQATETGISLTWMQDDFETLAGYNVYRSEAIDGYYQRLNQVVIPADVKTFFDDSVEPGVMYYYNFTVVKTDLTESVPSGKIVIMSLDTMAPNIYHTPVYQAYTGSNQIIAATITDNLMIQEAYLYYRVVGDLDWSKTLMYNNNDRYSAIIPAENVTLAGLEYYIEAYDGVSYTNKGSDLDPYLVTVIQSVDQNDLGDVNGDGQITVLDALMVLQAINDRLNLDQEAFLRADLDGSGNLEAWEALRILQYVNGNVTTIV